jgi:hypothetical protein
MKLPKPTYSIMDALLASPTNPTPESARLHQITLMYQGLASIEESPNPTPDDWRVCSDAVNFMESLVDMNVVEDSSGLLKDAVAALALAGERHVKHGTIRLDGPGIHAVRAVLEDYAAVLEVVPHRTMIQCHRRTEKRVRDILAGRGLPHDVTVIAV